MINPILERRLATTSCMSGPGRLIDRLIDKFLDHIEQLSSLVMPAQADRPTYVRIQTRDDQYPP